MLNAHTKYSAQRFHNVIYSNVLIIILCSLYDRLALYMLHISVLSFSKWLQSYFKHFKTIMETAHIWSVSEGNNVLFIGLNILAKCSHRADNDNRKKWHLSADTDMVADISCIPNIYIYIHISFFIILQIYGHLVQLPVTERLTKLNLFCYFYYFIAKCWSLFCCIQIWFIKMYIYCYILNLRLYFNFKCIRSTHFFFSLPFDLTQFTP